VTPAAPKPARFKAVEVKKRDTGKIKTNPKYRCLDEGGSGDDEEDINKNEDIQQLSSKELDFRETIIKNESK